MPLGKYHCDYCDKQFQDTPAARKRHLEGIQHQRTKALWYDSLKEGGAKGICNRFVRTVRFCLFCDFKLSHWQWQGPRRYSCNSCRVCVQCFKRRSYPSSGFCQYGDACKYLHPQKNTENPAQAISGNAVKDTYGVSMQNIPPSLRPPPEGGYPALPFVDWG